MIKKLTLLALLMLPSSIRAQVPTQTLFIPSWIPVAGRIQAWAASDIFQKTFVVASINAVGDDLVAGQEAYTAVQLNANERVSQAMEALAWCLDTHQDSRIGCSSAQIFTAFGVRIVPQN